MKAEADAVSPSGAMGAVDAAGPPRSPAQLAWQAFWRNRAAVAGMATVRRGGATVCANSSPARRSALRKEAGMFIKLEVDGSLRLV